MSGSYFSEDTIAAIATSLAGDGGVGIIRLSGPEALHIALANTVGLKNAVPRYLHRIEVVNPVSNETLDDGLGVYFPEGHSFTGEKVVELHLHGGRFLLQTILQQLISSGKCRLALPGEFSFRAVRNGKQSLSSASAISQLVKARSSFEVQAVRRKIGAARTKEFDALAAGIRNLLAQTELSIDFIDQDVEVISALGVKTELSRLIGIADRLLNQLRAAQRIAQGVLVTLTGSPNAGKSTLFNAILAEDRAIVSPEAGTTRDVITEEFALGPYRVRLADTAGLRDATGAIEQEGIERALELATEADVRILVIDAGRPTQEILAEIQEDTCKNLSRIVVLNKWDTLSAESQKRVQGQIPTSPGVTEIVTLSATTGLGLEALFKQIELQLNQKYGMALTCFLPTEFQLQMLIQCRTSLMEVSDLVAKRGLDHPELLSAALQASARALSDMVGETTPDTVLAQIFSEFCIGK